MQNLEANRGTNSSPLGEAGSVDVFDIPAMRGKVRVYMVPVLLEKKVVESLLHPRMHLVAPPGDLPTPPGMHPVLLEFNHQTQVRDLLGAQHNYYELILSIPGVIVDTPLWKLRSWVLSFFGHQSFNYMSVLYLDDEIAVVGGRMIWGFHKLFARFDLKREQAAESWSISHSGQAVCSATFSRLGTPQPALENPDFCRWLPIFRSRTVTRVPLFSLFDRSWALFMTTRYGWDLGRSPLRSASCRLNCGDPANGLPNLHCETEGISKDPLGGFQTFFPWYLTPAAPLWAPLRWMLGLAWRVYFWIRGLFDPGSRHAQEPL